MYLSTKQNFELDKIIKAFEVGYRSHIVYELKSKYPNVNAFSVAINRVLHSLNFSTVIFSRKLKIKAQKIKNEVASHYKKIDDSFKAFNTNTYQKEVPYVSDINDYVFLFFDDCFKNLANNFSTLEEFKDFASKYHLIRNSLSHPASSKIEVQQAKEIISFIKKLLLTIDDNKFWYVSKTDISVNSDDFIKSLDKTPLKFHNLNEISFVHNKIVCRDLEIKSIRNFIFGRDEHYRKSGSLIVYGYGGVGKTALVLEFLFQTIKDVIDEKLNTNYEFILFFTSKEEVLSFKETSGDLYINSIRQQVTSFKDYYEKLEAILKQNGIKDLDSTKGLIVIDNFENLSEVDKSLFFEYIKTTPRTVQFILTSRNEELSEDKLNLKEFKEISKGIKFINEFVEANEVSLPIKLTEPIKKELVELSKGNTLIIVLAIQLLQKGNSIEEVLSDLRGVEAINMEIIADFMYKNTIQQTIDDLEQNKFNPIEVLKVISLYEVPIDIYSISFLSKQNVSSVEQICNLFTSRLVLEKVSESYKPNDFANKFILSKYLPNNVEKKEIKNRIREYQRDLDYKLKRFDDTKRREPLLKGIMEDWKPKNSIDTIAIAESFVLFGETRNLVNLNNKDELRRIVKEFERIEKMTSHPYIRFQKARCYEMFLEIYRLPEHQIKIKEKISESYEEAIEVTDFYYPYIKNTKSYASINWIYGLFLTSHLNDLKRSARYLEDAIEIFRRLKIKDKVYYTALNNISWTYTKIYEKFKDRRYLHELRPIYNEVLESENIVRALDFDFFLYKRNFSKYFKSPTRSYKQKK